MACTTSGSHTTGRIDPQTDSRRLLSATRYRLFIHRIDAPHLHANPLHRQFEALADENSSLGGLNAIGQRF
jgi:hypothetical protein